MPLSWDPEVAPCIKPVFEAAASQPKIPVGDALKRRQTLEPLFEQLLNQQPFPPDIGITQYSTKATDGHDVPLYWFRNKDVDASKATPGPAVVHMHGGGMVLGNVPLMKNAIAIRAQMIGNTDLVD